MEVRAWRAREGTRQEPAGYGPATPLLALSPLAKPQHEAEPGFGGPFPCLPSQQEAEVQNTSLEQKGHWRRAHVVRLRFGTGLFDWIWFGERE